MLYVVMLGGKHPRAKIEVHDIAFAAGDTLEDTYEQLRQSWFGSPAGLHIDAWMAVDGVHEWKVELSTVSSPPDSPRLYFINLGGYESRTFGEIHQYLLVVANDRRDAMAQAKKRVLPHWKLSHTDGVLDVDDCLPIDSIAGRYVHLVKGHHSGVIQRNDYIVLA